MFLMLEELNDKYCWVRVGKRAWPNTDNGWREAWLTVTALRMTPPVAYFRITPYSL